MNLDQLPDPNYVGAEAGREHPESHAVWGSDHGQVWVDHDGEICMRSRYSGHCVADWHGLAILAAQRWIDTKMPLDTGEIISGERAESADHGTVLVRIGENGRIVPGQRVIIVDSGFTASPTARYRVLELPAQAA